MPADTYLTTENGRTVQKRATDSSAGAANAGDIVALDDSGKIPNNMLDVGVDSSDRVASEALDAGDLVNIWNDGGTPKVRKADASAEGKEAVGFVKEGYASGATVEVFFEGTIPGLTGLTPGSRQHLSTTAGEATETAPSGSGNVVQTIGIATSATEISFERAQPITLV